MIPEAVALALAALAAAAPPAAPAQPAPGSHGRVALDPLRSNGVAPALAEAVEERICSEIARATGGGDVVCPGDVAAAIAAARHSAVLGECTSDECLRRVDAMRTAERRVSGALEQGDEGLVLSLQVTSAAGPGPRVVEKLPRDVEALLSRLGGVVDKLFAER